MTKILDFLNKLLEKLLLLSFLSQIPFLELQIHILEEFQELSMENTIRLPEEISDYESENSDSKLVYFIPSNYLFFSRKFWEFFHDCVAISVKEYLLCSLPILYLREQMHPLIISLRNNALDDLPGKYRRGQDIQFYEFRYVFQHFGLFEG